MASYLGAGIVDTDMVYSTKVLAQILGHTKVETVERLLAEAHVPVYKWSRKITLVSGKLFQEAIERVSRCEKTETRPEESGPQLHQTDKPGQVAERAEGISTRSPGLLNRKDAAEYLGVSAATIDRMLQYGHIKAVIIPGTTTKRYTKQSLDDFIENETKEKADP